MRFQVPQFIETESKLVGPLTLKQFIWVALGVGLLLLLFRVLSGGILFLVSTIVIFVFGALAFYRIEGMPLIEYITTALSYIFKPKKYFFKKERKNNF